MKALLTVALIWILTGCAHDRAHRDCDRRLVPINGVMDVQAVQPQASRSKEREVETQE